MITEFVSIWLVGGVNWPASGSASNPSITLLSRLLSLLIHCFSRVFFCVFNWFFFFPVKGSRPGKNVQLTEGEIRGLCLKSREIFLSQPILLELEAPLKICGKFCFDPVQA